MGMDLIEREKEKKAVKVLCYTTVCRHAGRGEAAFFASPAGERRSKPELQ